MAAKLKVIFTGEKGSFSTPLTAKIVLDRHSEIGTDGERFLSVGCVSVVELEAAANNLKAQLDKIVLTSKRKFSRQLPTK